MSLTYNDTQQALSQMLRQFVSTRTPMSKVREVIAGDDAYAADTWRQIAGELGLAGLAIPEEYGGVSGTQSDIAAALRELGAGLVPSPMLGSAILATQALVELDDEAAKKEWLPRLAAGEITAAIAVAEPGAATWIPHSPSTSATDVGGSIVLSGTKTAVVNGADADIVVVQAASRSGVGLFLVSADAAGLVRTADKAADPTIGIATLHFDNTPASPLSGDAPKILDRILDKGNIAVAALQSGAINACIAMCTEYAKTRYSFGQPIGAYQGVKHKIADLYTAHQLADAQLRVATDASDNDADGASIDITAARLLFNDLHFRAALDNQLLHGGIGFTWEHDSHWYTKNAIVLGQLLGDRNELSDRLADKLKL
ncbi:acyl-CoA dehydrogenase family protein [Rhodococcus koreensis]